MRRPLFWLLVVTFSLKAAVLARFNAHPLLQPAGNMDSGVYARLAADVANGDLLLRGPGSVPFFVSPLYIYFLAGVHALSHGSLLAAKVVQIALGTAAAGLVYGMTRRLFGERAALPAGILYALTGFVTFYEVLILQAALDPFLTALCLYLLAVGLTSGSFSSRVKGGEAAAVAAAPRGAANWGPWLAAGAAFGLLSLNRPNALLCVAAIALALAAAPLVARRRTGRRSSSSLPLEEVSLRTFLPAAALLAGTGLLVALPLARNLIVSGEPVLLSSHGGLNFLVGNGPGANGVYRVVPGITPDIGGQAADAKRVAEAEEGRTLSTREVSAHFSKEAWTWIRENPGAAIGLFRKKIWYVLSRDEAPLNFSFPWYRDRSLALKLHAVGPGLLLPLAGAGLVLAFFASAGAARRNLLVWSAFIPAYVLAVAVFFVATRYRLPLVVALAPVAGTAIARLPEAWRAKGPRLGGAAFAAAVLAAVSLWPTGLWDGAQDEEMHLVLFEIERGDAGAMRHAETTASEHPDPALVWLRAGRSFEAAGKSDEAITALERSVAIDPGQAETLRVLSAALERRGMERAVAGDLAGAVPDLEEGTRLDSKNASVRLNLASILAERGDRARARALAAEALALRPGYENAEALLRALAR